ncbi:MAG: DUF4124 domain-containing protein [Burkholderiales bacterium]
MRRLLALALVLIPAAHAQTYKWLDEKGVVNYSNTQPPSAAKKIQPVADRISTYGPDPSLQRAIAYGPSPYELMAQQEWLQRQRLMATVQHQQAAYASYPYNDYAYAYPYYYGPATGVTRPPRASRPPHVAHHRGSSRF